MITVGGKSKIMASEVTIDGQNWVEIIRAMATAVDLEKENLSRLDATVGDGDHGFNMAVGLGTAATKVEDLPSPTPSLALQTAGSSLMNDMGGASGMVFGVFFRSCGAAVKGKDRLSKEDVGYMLTVALVNVEKRGKVQPGDKTMVDALTPAVREYQSAIEAGFNMLQALSKAAEGAQAGAESTQDMVAKVGRAKYLGERSLGYQDAGATTMALLFTAWEDVL